MVALAPSTEHRHGDVRLLEPHHLGHRLRIPGELGGQGLGQGDHRSIPRRADHRTPTLGHRRQQTGAQERALPRPRRTDQPHQMRLAQLLPDLLDLQLTAVEEVGVLLPERGEPRIGMTVRLGRDT